MNGDGLIDTSRLRPHACIVLAEGTMSALELDGLSSSGSLSLAALKSAYLEVGGRRVAKGRIRMRAGKAQFVITHVMEGANV